MDNITHSLAGAALGQAGLKRRSGLAMPAMILAANIPDVDIAYALIGEGLSGRRGWTHGPIGLLLLPIMLASLLWAFDRWQTARGKRPADRAPVDLGQLALLCYIAALSHPLLDLMNNWGIRLLMPFSERWFYGDALFIADPWIWAVAAGGIWLSRRRERRGTPDTATPAIAVLLAISLYGGAMAAAGRATEAQVAEQFRDTGHGEPLRVLASPVFADPFRRDIVVESNGHYAFGTFRWLPSPRFDLDPRFVPTHSADPRVARAALSGGAAADFLGWSRYPFAEFRSVAGGTEVSLGDARFGKRPTSGLMGATAFVPAPAPAPAPTLTPVRPAALPSRATGDAARSRSID